MLDKRGQEKIAHNWITFRTVFQKSNSQKSHLKYEKYVSKKFADSKQYPQQNMCPKFVLLVFKGVVYRSVESYITVFEKVT
jgi:hypothetical protein